MASFNKVILMGNLTRDVELNYTSGGTAVTEIGLAVNDRRKDANGQWQEETTFVDITLWGRTAEVCNEYLGKGSGVLIEGRLKFDTWDDKQTGQKRSKLRVTGERMQMLPRGENRGGSGGGNYNQASQSQPAQQTPAANQQDEGFHNAPPTPPPVDDDIPF
ncbi:MAG: single-stranded DNA-binding protein [Planctomycetota bacterium]|nr:single-stranded DNA-binding protein [Planctomycetota bacterium]